jgi:hypothetical protein
VIPAFPEFTPIDRAVIPAIERLATRFEPYSEYNAINMWCWAAKYRDVSLLNGNLVMRFLEGGTSRPAVSFLGCEAIRQTAAALVEMARLDGARLRLVPEVVLTADPELMTVFAVQPEANDADYILSIEDWAALDGSARRSARQQVALFDRRADAAFVVLDLGDMATQAAMLDRFRCWAEQKGMVNAPDTAIEMAAFRRMLGLIPNPRLRGYGLVEEDRLLAFVLCECIDGEHVAAHFWKADRSVPGIYMTLMHRTCRALVAEGYRFLNIGQDLGHPGMAQAKRSLRPCRMLRKYALTAR